MCKLIALLIISCITSFLSTGCVPPTEIDERSAVQTIYPLINQGETHRFVFGLERTEMWDQQEMTLKGGDRSKKIIYDGLGLVLTGGYRFGNNLYVSLHLDEPPVSPTLRLSIQYDLIHWNNGKAGLGATVGSNRYGIQLFAAQNMYTSAKHGLISFISLQYFRQKRRFMNKQESGVENLPRDNDITILEYSFMPLLGLAYYIKDVSELGGSLEFEISGGYNYITSSKLESELYSGSDYYRSNGPVGTLSVHFYF